MSNHLVQGRLGHSRRDSPERRHQGGHRAPAIRMEAIGANMRGVVRAELQAVGTEVWDVRTELKGEMALSERRLQTRLGSLIVAAVGVLFAALRHWSITGP